MSVKQKEALSFEALAEKTKLKKEKGKLFSSTFLKAFSMFVAFSILYSITYLAFSPSFVTAPTAQTQGGNNALPAGNNAQGNNSESPDAQGGTSADANNGANAQNPQAAGKELVGNDVSVIVPYFVAAHNKVKSSAKSATLVWKKGQNYQGIADVGDSATLSKAVNSLMSSLLKEENPGTVYNGKDEIGANFPPANASCNLKVGDVRAAKCTENNGVYTVQLVLNPDLNPTAGNGSGAIASVLTEETITEPVPKFLKLSNIKCDYQGAKVECKIEKSTGNMTYYYCDTPMFLYLTAAKNDCKLGLEFEEKWDIAW